jgi:hypothetical protein
MVMSVSELMAKEHARLDGFLEEVGNKLSDNAKAKEAFNMFKWNMRKHFFVEEKGIFDYLMEADGEKSSNVFHLVEDHEKIIELMKEVEDGLDEGVGVDISSLRDAIHVHRNYENNDFYPRLDEELTDEQKVVISERIKEIIPA